MRFALVICTVLGMSTVARADTFGALARQSSSIRLLDVDYHPAARPPVPRPPRALAPPAALNPVNHVKGSVVLIGLSLVGAGLVLGGAGFALLYVCREGQGCHNQGTTIAGWVLAAPGILPLVVGAIMLYASSGGRADLLPKETAGQWAFSVSPLNGGGLLSGSVRF